MRLRRLPMRILLLSAVCWLGAAQGIAQQPGPANQTPDVVRVNTSLVQTDVMVFDKQGRFVDGLKRDQFVLKVDGRPRDISFFEPVVAGSRNEEAQLAAARGNAANGNRPGNAGVIPLDRGRTVFFFIDDMHMSIASMNQVKSMLGRFIDREMGQNDEVAIASPSGQIGFLQQLTDDKLMLKAAVDRLQAKTIKTTDLDSPPMTEYQAILIEGGQDDDVFTYFVDELLKQNPLLPRRTAEEMVRTRASQIVQQLSHITTNMFAPLKSVISTTAALPGRKLLFFVSDGLLLDTRGSDSQRLKDITSAAAATGVVIYSIFARGLTSGMPDASTQVAFDPSGRLMRSISGEVGASQLALNDLAVDTGGRAFLNTNALSAAVTTGLKETSNYYLLAWRPESSERPQKAPRVEVSVNGRPELVVRFRRAFGEVSTSSTTNKTGQGKPKLPGDLMREAIRAPYPPTDLPVAVSLNFLDVAQHGGTLTASLKVSTSSLVFDQQGSQAMAILDIGGIVYTDQGTPVSSFNKRLTIRPNSGDAASSPPDSVFYNHFCALKPGLYQVRVAAVDFKQLRVGSAVRWIQIPDLGTKALTLSSLIVGERKAESEGPQTLDASEPGKAPDALSQVTLNVDHHFSRSSHLRFLTFVYNARAAAPGAIAPAPVPDGGGSNSVPASSTTGPGRGYDLAVQVQVFRDNEPVITTPLSKIQLEGVSDLARLPYAAEVTLDTLAPGRYVLLVTVIDRLAKASASQRFGFQVD